MWGSSQLFGAACALGAGLCWALYIYFWSKSGTPKYWYACADHCHRFSALCLAHPLGSYNNAPALFDTQYWAKALMIAILATAIPYALDLKALKILSKLDLWHFIELSSPALAAITGLVLLGESIGDVAMGGLGLHYVGIGRGETSVPLAILRAAYQTKFLYFIR